MKKINKIVVGILAVCMFAVSAISVFAYTIDITKDFKPKTSIEKTYGHYKHTNIGTALDGSFFESVTQDVTGTNKETGTQNVRIRYYITQKGNSGSYIYQKVPVGIKVDGKKVATLTSWINKHISNKTQLCGEITVALKPGSHTIELFDDKPGAITVVNVKFMFRVPYIVDFYNWDGNLLKRQNVPKGGDATPPTPPDRPGYHFVGWDKSYTNITENKDITAKYEINRYTVTWKDYNGTVLKTETVNHGGNASPPASPSRPGYTFTGWDSGYTNITSNRTITATYRINYYNAVTSHWVEKDTASGAWNPSGSLNSSGSMILSSQTGQQSLSYGSIYYPHSISITGYELSSNSYGYNAPGGWSSKANGTGFNIYQASTAEFYYKKKTYNVSFDSNGGSAAATQIVKYRNKATSPTITKKNFKFLGWYADKNLTQRYDFNTQITGNTTLYAKWERTHYDIQINHKTYDVINGWKEITSETRNVAVNSVIDVKSLAIDTIPLGYEKENAYDLYLSGKQIGNTYSLPITQKTDGSFDQIIIRYKATKPELKAKDTYYFIDTPVSAKDLIERASATDVKDKDIAEKIIIEKIKYPDRTEEKPSKLDTSKEQDITITYSVTNSRGVKVYATAEIHIVFQGSHTQEVSDEPTIYARFISNDVLVNGKTPVEMLPPNSIWRTEEYAAALQEALTNDTPLAEYDWINSDPEAVRDFAKSTNPGEETNKEFIRRFKR
ncbi:InlB B-repeat-containing protein [[Clostridium] innocuum]|nr:InlB B-repeat-containing protein [[Clostridium] innocuum]MCR0577165.1 InlB B-repeat-containing protein [[Clostridium] innocuum]